MRKLRHREAECHATVIGLQGRDRSRSRAVWLQILPPAPRPYAACTRGRGLSGDGGKLRGPAGPGEPWSCRASRVSVSRWPCAGGKPVASGSLCFCPPTLTCSQVPGEPCSCPPSLGHLLGPRPSWDPNPSHLEPIDQCALSDFNEEMCFLLPRGMLVEAGAGFAVAVPTFQCPLRHILCSGWDPPLEGSGGLASGAPIQACCSQLGGPWAEPTPHRQAGKGVSEWGEGLAEGPTALGDRALGRQSVQYVGQQLLGTDHGELPWDPGVAWCRRPKGLAGQVPTSSSAPTPCPSPLPLCTLDRG